MKVVNQVLSTNDYGMFKTLGGNRNVNKLHVNRLKESFKTAYLLNPILINQENQIIDGQHRFEAAKDLGLPINYIICNDYGIKEVQLLNTNMKNWNKEDYLNAYCNLNFPEYIKFKKFMNRFPEFGMLCCEYLLLNRTANGVSKTNKGFAGNKSGKYMIKYFQEGDLKIPNYEFACENAEKLKMIKQYYKGFNRPIFVAAMVGLFNNDLYNHSHFMNKLYVNPASLVDCANVSQYKLLIEEIYNYRSREKVSLRF